MRRWRQRKAVVRCRHSSAAALRTLSPSCKVSHCANQRWRCRSRDNGVPVSALKVIVQARHLYRCNPSACPRRTTLVAPHLGQWGLAGKRYCTMTAA